MMEPGHIDDLARWIETLMRDRGYDIDSPRGGGRARLAEDAGVHRAAVSRLLQRQSMPDLDTMRRLAAVLGVGMRDMLIRSGRLTESDLPLGATTAEPGGRRRKRGFAPRLTAEQAADELGIPAVHRQTFLAMVGAMTAPGQGVPEVDARSAGG